MNEALKSAVIHVGVNVTNTCPLLMVCPVFEDGSFIFIPIPSEGEGTYYRELDSVSGVCEILEQLGYSLDTEVHNDPEFVGLTFGEGPRDWMLARLCPGDLIFFIASMKKIPVPSKVEFLKNPKLYSEKLKGLLKQNRGPDWFYGLIAQIKISEIFAGKNKIKHYNLYGKCRELDRKAEEILKTNAHVKRRDHHTCIIVKGESNESKLYNRALPISLGNNLLTEIQDIFNNKVLKRGRKWFEVILNEEGTNSLLNFVISKNVI